MLNNYDVLTGRSSRPNDRRSVPLSYTVIIDNRTVAYTCSVNALHSIPIAMMSHVGSIGIAGVRIARFGRRPAGCGLKASGVRLDIAPG